MDIENEIRYAEVSPILEFRFLCQPTKLTDVKVEKLDSRDLFDNGQQIFGLNLSYSLNGNSFCYFKFFDEFAKMKKNAEKNFFLGGGSFVFFRFQYEIS